MKFNETPAEARKLLVDALNSGEYQQGKRCLNKDGKYCCLGVACDVFVKLYPNVVKVEENKNGNIGYDGETHTLPNMVREWLNFNSYVGELKQPEVKWVGTNHNCSTLAMVNDYSHYNFKQIAQLIEDDKVALKEKE